MRCSTNYDLETNQALKQEGRSTTYIHIWARYGKDIPPTACICQQQMDYSLTEKANQLKILLAWQPQNHTTKLIG